MVATAIVDIPEGVIRRDGMRLIYYIRWQDILIWCIHYRV